jgi:hypothetical protein
MTKHKPLKLHILLLALAVAIVSGLGGWLFVRSKSPAVAKSLYSSATELSAATEVERVITENLNLSGQLTVANVAKHLLASKINSGDTSFIIYRFDLPETTGKAGRLHVAIDQTDKRSIPLQLVDLPNQQPMFASTKTHGCFIVKQPGSGARVEDYEICGNK